MSTLMDQCRLDAEVLRIQQSLHPSWADGYAAALYHERSKRPPTVQQVIDAAVEVFGLGPEDQEAVLRFGMKLQDMQGPPMITVEEAIAIVQDWAFERGDWHIQNTVDREDLRERLTAAATNNTNDNG